MSNFPGKWFDFTTNKEIKRIRKDLNNTLVLKIEISTSIILTIVAFCFSEHIKKLAIGWQICFCLALCLVVLFVFFVPYIIKWISTKHNGNIIIKGKDAVSTFDEEIVYNVLVAAEYYNSLGSIKRDKVGDDLKAFYDIEIEYYLMKAIDELLKFNTNYSRIFGDNKNQIPLNRLKNILDLIFSIKNSSSVSIDNCKDKAIKEFYKYFFGDVNWDEK